MKTFYCSGCDKDLPESDFLFSISGGLTILPGLCDACHALTESTAPDYRGQLERLIDVRKEDKKAFDALRERAWQMRKALEVTRGNILSLKGCAGGSVAFDAWLDVVNEAAPGENVTQ